MRNTALKTIIVLFILCYGSVSTFFSSVFILLAIAYPKALPAIPLPFKMVLGIGVALGWLLLFYIGLKKDRQKKPPSPR